jgi:pyridoxamine 5'-phosphate oxidase
VSDAPPDPIAEFSEWFEAARAAGIRLSNAMTLATSTPEGAPSARMVLLKGFDEDGFVFYTNYESRKGKELAANPRAALVFYWSGLDKQVCITGTVSRVSTKESEDYFKTRPLGSRLGAWASRQSEVIPDRDVLERRWEELADKFSAGQVPLPDFWGGFRLYPETIEFWSSRPNRLHDRLRYTRSDGGWLVERLSP